MEFDFNIQKIDINFKIEGQGNITIKLNGKIVGNSIDSSQLNSQNTLEFLFFKDDPSDQSSFAELINFYVNGGEFKQKIKVIPYNIDIKKHPDAPAQIMGNLYFGYIGTQVIEFSHRNDLLAKAAWTLADNEFEHIKWPLKGENYRSKTFDTLHRDAKFMFTGSLAPANPEVNKMIDQTLIGDLRKPLDTTKDRLKIEEWINKSERIKLKNFQKMNNFTYSNGILDSLNSFVTSIDVVYMPKKMYYFYGEVLQDKNISVRDLMSETLEPESNVMLELPSPWYDTQLILDKIQEAKNKRCKVAVDLTWLPGSTDTVDIDLDMLDQVFFSMNKTWPIHDVRPAFRWSKQRINDSQTFQYEYSSYPKVGANLFMKLIDSFPLDYIYNKYKDQAQSIRDLFALEKTSVLWFTKHELYQHDNNKHISEYYFLDDFVCIRKLLDYHGKYFW